MGQPIMPEETDRLDSWKQIAAYLNKSERTVRRWHETEGLPVHRHLHQQKGSVWAYSDELQEWLARRTILPESQELAEPLETSAAVVSASVVEDSRYKGRWIGGAAIVT